MLLTMLSSAWKTANTLCAFAATGVAAGERVCLPAGLAGFLDATQQQLGPILLCPATLLRLG